MKTLIKSNKLILAEGAIIEQLRRSDEVQLDGMLVNAPLIYDSAGKQALRKLYQGYMRIAQRAKIPFIMSTPTWRTNYARVKDSQANPSINIDAAHFLMDLRDEQTNHTSIIKIGGMIGCKNDCYRPEESLSAAEAEQFHLWQLEQLTQGGVDFLKAETLPALEEAIGIAKAMETTNLPYIISFVINRNGYILDGTSLYDAICKIDSITSRNPLGYMVNCAYPTFLCPAQQPKELFSRLIGYQANASSLDHCELDNADTLKTEDVAEWGNAMLTLNHSYGVKILGGCCGTGIEHLQYIVNHIQH